MSEDTSLHGVTQKIARFGRAVQPLGERTIVVLLMSAFAVVLLLEINEGTDGVIAEVGKWFWNSVLAYRTVNFGAGLLLCYMLMRQRRARFNNGVRNRIFNTAPIVMDLDTLERHAKEHGIELRLREDPRISKQNPAPLSKTTPDLPSQAVQKDKRDKRG